MIMVFLSARFFNKPFVMVLHAIYNYPVYIIYLLQSASSVIFRSDYIREKYIEKYPEIKKKLIEVIPCGIDTAFFRRRKFSKSLKNKIFTILSICRFVEMKGIMDVLEACRKLKENRINFKYNLVGYGPERMKYYRYIKKNKIKKYVKIYSPLSHSRKLLNIYLKADIFVLPSVIDSKGEVDVIPNACLEAMAMELPVITTRVGGMHEVITDGVNGFFCKENDAEDLARIIRKVMDMPLKKRREIGRRAREVVVERFDKEKQGKKFVEFLRSQVKNEQN